MDQVRNDSISHINLAKQRVSTECVRREASSSGELNQAITSSEWRISKGNRFARKLDIFQLGALLECATANSLELFVADDTFEGGAGGERPPSSMILSLSERVTLLRADQCWNASMPIVLRFL